VKITAREKRFLIIGGGITVLVIGYYLASSLIPSSVDLAQEIESRKALLLRQKEMISQEDNYKARVSQYEQRLAKDRERLLPGDNPSTAAASLQKVLQDFADRSGVEITSKTIQADQKIQDNLTKISVQLSTNCSIDELVRFLAAIENYEKFLRVEELYVQGLRLRNRDEIRPQLKVAGYVTTPPPATKPADKAASGN
jgi:type II secretory pathway component PulM